MARSARHRLHRSRPSPANPVADLSAHLGERQGAISGNLVTFGRLLRAAGFDVTAGRLIDAGRGLRALGSLSVEDIRVALRANLVSEQGQIVLFDTLFDLYWRTGDTELTALPLAEPEEQPSQGSASGSELAAFMRRSAHAAEGDNPSETSGNADLLTVKDFADYTDADLMRARRVIRTIAPHLASALSRRKRRAPRGDDIDLRSSLRHAARHGGEIVHLVRRRRRLRRLRLTVLCDVSGSMDLYSRQLVQVLFALQNELRGVRTFVFSTRLHEVTHLLKTRSFDEALARVSRDVDSWSGGTSIGRCLRQFERGHARRSVDSRTVLVIVSDGWERGDVDDLRQVMVSLKRRAHRIVWLNPLLGHPGYQPIARGMAAALPHVDLFLPAHSLDALARAVRTIGAISQH